MYIPNTKNSLDADAMIIFFPVKIKSRRVAYFKSARIRGEYIFVHHMGIVQYGTVIIRKHKLSNLFPSLLIVDRSMPSKENAAHR